MNIATLLRNAEKNLKRENVPSARLDCLIMLEDALKKDRAWILAHPEAKLTKNQLSSLDRQIERRAKHEPLAYIRGKSAFYGRDFFVTADTLQPRPETETMVELVLDQVNSAKYEVRNIIDVGTGSGAIATTLKLELPSMNVVATDISEKCIQVAKKNAKLHKADISLVQTNLVEGVQPNNLDNSILCCNLPYVPDSFSINQAAMFEPKIAIFGGEDGLDYYRKLFEQLEDKKAKPKAILTESLPTQHKNLESITKKFGYRLIKSQDFIQVFTRL